MIGTQSMEINHPRQPYDHPRPTPDKKQRRVLEENKLGHQLQTADHITEEHSSHPANLLSN